MASLLVCIPNSKNEIATPPFRISELVDTKHRGFAMTKYPSHRALWVSRGSLRRGDLNSDTVILSSAKDLSVKN